MPFVNTSNKFLDPPSFRFITQYTIRAIAKIIRLPYVFHNLGATAGQPKEVHEQVAAITPLRRLGMPDDIAGVVLFLASSLSDYLNGEYIPVTGGSFMI